MHVRFEYHPPAGAARRCAALSTRISSVPGTSGKLLVYERCDRAGSVPAYLPPRPAWASFWSSVGSHIVVAVASRRHEHRSTRCDTSAAGLLGSAATVRSSSAVQAVWLCPRCASEAMPHSCACSSLRRQSFGPAPRLKTGRQRGRKRALASGHTGHRPGWRSARSCHGQQPRDASRQSGLRRRRRLRL